MPKLVDFEGVGTVEVPDDFRDSELTELFGQLSQGRHSSAAGAFMRAGGEMAGNALSGAARITQAFPPPTHNPVTGAPIPRGPAVPLEEEPIYKFGQDLAGGARDAFPVNPLYADNLETAVASGAGSVVGLLPSALAGPAAPFVSGAAYGLSSGEQGAQEASQFIDNQIAEALAKGDEETAQRLTQAKPGIVNKTFAGYGAAGALSEGVLGVAGKMTGLVKEGAKRGILNNALRGAGSEALQEGGEQAIQNVTSKALYDPNRSIAEGVGMNAGAGGIVGGLFGGGAAALGARQRKARLDAIRADRAGRVLNPMSPEDAALAPLSASAVKSTAADAEDFLSKQLTAEDLGLGPGAEPVNPDAPYQPPVATGPVATVATPEEIAQAKADAAAQTVTAGTPTVTPTPEPPEVIAAQLALTASPDSSKAVTLVTPGEDVSAVPEGLQVAETPHGTAIFNPQKTTEQQVEEAAAGDIFDPALLGMGAAVPQSDVAVTTTGPDGTRNVLSELVTEETVQQAMQAQQEAVPGGTTEVVPASQVLQERGQGAGSDVQRIISEARDTQARFLKEIGTTIEEARKLPKTQQAKLQSDYEAWLKTEGGFRIPPQAGDTTGWKGTQDWRKAVDQVQDIEDKLDWIRAVANNRGSKAAALDLSDALDKVESLRLEWPEHSRIGNALWDIAQNPAASAETKSRALAAREDLLSHGGKFPAPTTQLPESVELNELRITKENRGLGRLNQERLTELEAQVENPSIEAAVRDSNWRGTVREVPAPRSMGGAGVKLYIPVDAAGNDVSVGGQMVLGKSPAEAIELAQKNVKPAPAPQTATKPVEQMTPEEMNNALAVLLNAPSKAGGKPRVSFKTNTEQTWFRRGFEAANERPGQPPPEQRPGVPAKEQKLHDAFAQGWGQAQMKLRSKAAAKPATTPQTAAKPVEQMTPEEHSAAYPVIGNDAVVDGREVINADDIPNMSSIDSSIGNPKTLDGIREVPMSDFTLTGRHYSVAGQKNINKLADKIAESGQITPLIVVRDGEGLYILEGATRAEALFKLGAKSFPAKVVLDLDSIEEANSKSKPAAAPKPAAPAPQPAAKPVEQGKPVGAPPPAAETGAKAGDIAGFVDSNGVTYDRKSGVWIDKSPRMGGRMTDPKAIARLNEEVAQQSPAASPAPTPQLPSSPARVQLKSGPQTFTVEEQLPAQDGDQPGEVYFQVKNEKTGEVQTVESGDLKPVKQKPGAAVEADPVEALLTRAIDATNPRGKTHDFVSGVSHAVANAALKIARAVYIATRDMTAAVRAAVAHMRDNATDGFDEAEAEAKIRETLGEKKASKRNSLRVKLSREALTDLALSQEKWKDWYKEHQDTLDAFFGSDAGLFQKILAITSQASSVKANVGLALKAFAQFKQGLDFDGKTRGEESSGYLPAVIGNLNALRAETQIQGRKIGAYTSANEGKTDSVVVDRHIARMLFGVDTPSAAQYAKASKVLTEIANELGWEPRQVQAALWAASIVKSGKEPQSYGQYIRSLHSNGTLKERIGHVVERSSEVHGNGGLGVADSGGVQEADGGVRFSGITPTSSVAEVVDAINKGDTNTALKAVNQVVDEAKKLRDRVKAEIERRTQPRRTGKGAILDQIVRAANSGRISTKARDAILSFLAGIPEAKLADTAISIRRGESAPNYSFGENLVSLFLGSPSVAAVGVERTATHEFWHGLSRFLPQEEVDAMERDYKKALAEHIKKNPGFLALVGRYTLTPQQYAEYEKFASKEDLARLTPIRGSDGEITGYKIGFTPENYRFVMLDEWIAEKMSDLVEGKQSAPDTFLGKLAKIFKEFLSTIKAKLGLDQYEKFYQSVMSDDARIPERDMGVKAPEQIYNPENGQRGDVVYSDVQQALSKPSVDFASITTNKEDGIIDVAKLKSKLSNGEMDVHPWTRAILQHLLGDSSNHPLSIIRVIGEDFSIIGFQGKFSTRAGSNSGRIEIASKDKNGNPLSEKLFSLILAHELVHNAITSKLSDAESELRNDANRLFEFVKEQAKGTKFEKHNALKNVNEFFSEALSRKSFQEFLMGMDYSMRAGTQEIAGRDVPKTQPDYIRNSAFGGFLGIIKKALGIPGEIFDKFTGNKIDAISALDSVVSISNQLQSVRRSSSGYLSSEAGPQGDEDIQPPAAAPGARTQESRGQFTGLITRDSTKQWSEAAAGWISQFNGDLNAATVAAIGGELPSDVRQFVFGQLLELTNQAIATTKNPIERNQLLNLQARQAAVMTDTGAIAGKTLAARFLAMKAIEHIMPVLLYRGLVRKAQLQAIPFTSVTSDAVRSWLTQAGRQAVAETREAMTKANAVVARVLKQQVSDYGQTWRDIVTASTEAQGNHRAEIFKRIAAHPTLQGLDQASQIELTNLLSDAWERERMKIFRSEFRKMVPLPKKTKEVDAKKLLDSIPDLVKQANLGLLDDAQFRDALAKRYGVASVNDATARRLNEMAQAAQKAPSGVMRSRILSQMVDLIQVAGGISKAHVLRDYWYAAVLSSPRTQVDNGMALLNGALMTALASARNPQAAPFVWRAFTSGLAEAGRDFLPILQGERWRMANIDIDRPASVLDTLQKSPNYAAKALGSFAYVGRMIAALDHLNTLATREAMLAWAIHRSTDGDAREMMRPGPADIAAARERAVQEGTPSGLVQKRTREILEERISPELLLSATTIGQEAAYQSEPYGFLGYFYRAIKGLDKLPYVGGVSRILSGTAFARYAVNASNDMLNYAAPIALFRWYVSATERQATSKLNFTPEQRDLILMKAALGTVAATAAAAAFLGGGDDDKKKRAIDIQGSFRSLEGPKRNQLLAEGNIPYSIRIGDTYISYRQLPVAAILGTIGEMRDRQKYQPDQWKEESVAANIGNGAIAGMFLVRDSAAISSFMDFLGVANAYKYDVKGISEKSVPKYVAKMLGSLVPNAAKDVDAWVDPSLYRGNSASEYFLQQLPLARQLAGEGPLLNLFGEPVKADKYPWSRWVSAREVSPEWEAAGNLAARGLFLPQVAGFSVTNDDGTRRKATPRELYAYQREVGAGYKQFIRENSAELLSMDPKEAADFIKTETSAIRRGVRSDIQP